MRTFRYDTSGQWFKGNPHVHTTCSDGGKTPEQQATDYAGAGYDFLVRTDHWVTTDVAAEPDGAPLLWLDGVELDGSDETGAYFHVVAIGRFVELEREMGLVTAMAAVREQGGLLILAHPHWCGNTTDDALRHHFDGVEAYNHVCRWLNGKGDGLSYWDWMLKEQPNTLGLAVDDSHCRPEHPGWNGGWLIVNAPELTRDAIMAGIRTGNFYSSQGPDFFDIQMGDGEVTVKTSPVSFIRLVGPNGNGRRVGSFEGKTFTEATFELPADWPAPRLEIEDANGRRAWTNSLFVGD